MYNVAGERTAITCPAFSVHKYCSAPSCLWIWVAKGKGGDGQAGQIWLGMTMYSAHCAVVGVIFHFC